MPLRQTVWTLAACLLGALAATALADRATAPPRATPEQIERWIAELDAGSFAAREGATRRLIEAGGPAVTGLGQISAEASVETIQRTVLILATMCADGNATTETAAQAALEKLGRSEDGRLARRAQEALDDYREWKRDQAIGKIERLGGSVDQGDEPEEGSLSARLGHSWRGGDWGVEYLRSLPGLRQVSFEETLVTDAVLPHVAELPLLEKLYLGPSRLRGIGLKNLERLSRLDHLSLRGARLEPAGFAELCHLRQVHALGLDDTGASDADLACLSQLKQLEVLWLNNDPVTDAGLKQLAGLTNLTRLELAGTQVTGSGLPALKPLERLTGLTFESTPLDDAGVAQVAQFSQLKALGLDHTRITDQGAAELAKLKQLEQLWLSGTAITDAGLKHFYGLTNLRTLHLDETAVTENGVSALQQQLPQLEISH